MRFKSSLLLLAYLFILVYTEEGLEKDKNYTEVYTLLFGKPPDAGEKDAVLDKVDLNPVPTSTSSNASASEKDLEKDEKYLNKLFTIFGKPPNADEKKAINLNPLSILTPGNTSASCELEDKTEGICVIYYQCDPTTKMTLIHGDNIIDLRDSKCPSSLETCCSPNLVNTTSRIPAPVKTETPAKCGYSNPGAQAFKIVNDGTTAEFGEYPWMVAILKKSTPSISWNPGDYLAGGSIIHPRVVLTVGHKIEDMEAKEIKCRAGEWDTKIDQEVYPHQERAVRKIVIHENFYRPSALNNVALLFLERDFDISSETPHMGVGCLGHRLPDPGTECQTMGWGKNSFNNTSAHSVILKKLELPLVSRQRCQNALRGTRLGPRFQLHQSFTCAGGVKGKDTCKGDGGSPLICPIGDAKELRFAIVGTVAWGIGCGEEGVPGVYVNIPSFRSWISEQMMLEGIVGDSYEYDD